MKQCDYCGNYDEGLETVTISNYYSDGSSETVDLCPEHLSKLNILYPPYNAQMNQLEPPDHDTPPDDGNVAT